MIFPSGNAGSKAGNLFIWCTLDDVAQRFEFIASKLEMPKLDTGTPYVLGYQVAEVSGLLDHITAEISDKEQRELRVLYSDSVNPAFEEFGAVKSLEQFCHELSSRWLMDLLTERRLKTLMQPIVYADDHSRVLSYEFLLRGIDREGAEIPAPTMFKAGSDSGALYLLDLAAGEVAMETAVRHNLKEKLFINVLPSTLADNLGVEAWLETMSQGPVDMRDRLVFELVESEHFGDYATLSRLAEDLRQHGIGLALDDFGSGFNNLSALSVVRPDYIKLDKSLIQNLLRDPQKWNLVANMVDAAKQADVCVIAEGIEDEETAMAVTSIGVDYLQGYYFGYPKDEPVGLTIA